MPVSIASENVFICEFLSGNINRIRRAAIDLLIEFSKLFFTALPCLDVIGKPMPQRVQRSRRLIGSPSFKPRRKPDRVCKFIYSVGQYSQKPLKVVGKLLPGHLSELERERRLDHFVCHIQ